MIHSADSPGQAHAVHVSVLICCLCFTSVGAQVTPEAEKLVLNEKWAAVREFLQQHGGAETATGSLFKAYAALMCGRPGEATEHISQLTGPAHTPELLRYASSVARENPSNAIAQVIHGYVLACDGQFDAALGTLDTAITLAPNSAIAFDVRGVVRALAGHLADAETDLERAIELMPALADAYASLGLVRARLGDTGAAVEAFTRAIELAPDFALAYNGRGVAFALMEAWDEAESDFTKASTLSPSLEVAAGNARFLAWRRGQTAFRQSRLGSGDGRGSTLVAQSFDHRQVDIGGGRTMDVFVIKATSQTATLEGMQDVMKAITQELRTENRLPATWQPRLHMDVHGWRTTPYAEMPYAANMAQQAGVDAVIAVDVSRWYKYPSPGGIRAREQELTWHDNVTQATGQTARINAAINSVTGIRPTFTGHSGGTEVIPRMGEMITHNELPNEVVDNLGFRNVVLAAYPFHKLGDGDVAVANSLLERVEGRVFNFHTVSGNWSNKLLTNDKVANILVTDSDGHGITHTAWNSPTLHGGPNPIIDVGGGALRGWQPETVQKVADQVGRQGQVPLYSISVSRPLTEAVTMASLTERGLRPGERVLIGSTDAERSNAMLQPLRAGGWQVDCRQVTDPTQLQSIAKAEGYSRVLLVKNGTPDDASRAFASDAQKMPAAPLPSVRSLMTNIDRFNEASNLLYDIAGKDMPPNMKVPLAFTTSTIQDLRAARAGEFSPWTSHTLERIGEFGMKELPVAVKALQEAGRLPSTYTLSPLLQGLPDFVAGGASQLGRKQIVPTIDEITHYLDGFNKAMAATTGTLIAGPQGGVIASGAAGLTADVARGITEPLFQHVAHDPVRKQMVQDFRTHVDAAVGHGVQVKTFTEMFGPQLIQRVGLDRRTVAELDSCARWVNSSGSDQNLARPIPVNMSVQQDDVTMKLEWRKPLKPPDPPDKFGGAGVPSGNYRLPSAVLPGDKRGGVAMKADVVKNKAADMSEMFGATSSQQDAGNPGQDGFVCPFLLFCASPPRSDPAPMKPR